MGQRSIYAVENAIYGTALAAGTPYAVDLGKIPTNGPRGGLNIVERIRFKTPTVATTIPAGKSLDPMSLGQTFKIQLQISPVSPFAKEEGGTYLIPEGVWWYDLMRIWALATGMRVLRFSNGRVRAPQISAADVLVPLDVYCTVKETDDRPNFPQLMATTGDDGGGGAAAFSSRLQGTIDLIRRGEHVNRGIPAAHFNGRFLGCNGQSSGRITFQPSTTLKIDGTAFTLSATDGFEVVVDLYELDPGEVCVPIMPRLRVDTPNDKNFAVADPMIPTDILMEAPEDAAGVQAASTLTTAFLTHGPAQIGDPAGDMTRYADYIADTLQRIRGENWGYPVSQAALTSTVNVARLLRWENILFCAAGMSLLDQLPAGALTQVNVTSGTIPTGGWRLLKMGWAAGSVETAKAAAEMLGASPNLTPLTRNGNDPKAHDAAKMQMLPKQAFITAESMKAAIAKYVKTGI